MTLKRAFSVMVFTTLLACGGLARADEYRADEFLGLDLSGAVLSKKLLGPETQFAPYPVEAKGEVIVSERAPPRVEPKALPRAAAVKPHRELRVAQARGAGRTALTRRHGNPLDAQARDTRIQVWPCKSGGICDWQR